MSRVPAANMGASKPLKNPFTRRRNAKQNNNGGHNTGRAAWNIARGRCLVLGYVGGNSDNVSNGNAGPSYLNAYNDFSNSNTNIGARLTNLQINTSQHHNLTLHAALPLGKT